MTRGAWRTPAVVLFCGSAILTLALGIRHGFGLYLQPMSADHGWGREVFGLAIAVQNLLWGLSQPFTGMLADRYGAGRVLLAGAVIYALGLLSMACASTPIAFILGAGVLIGLFNIFGSYTAGWLGGHFRKTYLLSILYAIRGVAMVLLLAFPLTPASTYVFASVLGFTWLGTAPLTNGVVAGMFGVKHLATLSGFVYLSHQVGSFFGGWMGGYLYDATGSYQVVWTIAIALSVTAALVNLPIDERPVGRRTAAA